MTDASGDGIALARSIAQSSRPAGSEAEQRARATCAEHLASRGFQVVEHPFEYSTWLGKWATPAIGASISVSALGAAWEVASRRFGTAQLLSALPIVLGGALAWSAGRWGTGPRHGQRVAGVNLVARRGVPDVWLTAHIDTKGQPVSLVVRAAGVVLVAVGWLVTLCGWIVFAMSSATTAAPVLLGGLVLAALGGIPLAGSLVLDRGTGALDNASGIATIFEAVDQLPPDFPVGVVVTTAEELALAGARAWAETELPGVALNCDGVDDEGEIVCVVAQDTSGRLARGIARGEASTGASVRVRRTLPGVLFDSVALGDAGWDAMTVTRGTVRSLARVHTAGDTLAAWKGTGVAATAAFLAAVAGAIVAEQHAVLHGDHPARREE